MSDTGGLGLTPLQNPAGGWYEIVMGSWGERGGMFLELWDCHSKRLALWAFYSDADGSFEFERYRDDVPPRVEARFRREAERKLPPSADA